MTSRGVFLARYLPLLATALLALHAGLALWAASHKGTTGDELQHLTAGYTYWSFHDYRLHPENGILPQRWAALPAYLMQVPFPTLQGNESWTTSGVQPLGHQFFYETGHDPFAMLMAGRAMIVVFNVGTGILIFCWSRQLFGDLGALFSVTLFALSPTFLAHGALITSDACMAFFFLACCGAWWRHLHHPGPLAWAVSTITFGLACVAKHSAVLLLPMMGILALARIGGTAPIALAGRSFATPSAKFGAVAMSALIHGAVGCFVIWLFYGFRYEAFNPAVPPAAHFIRPWELIDSHIGWVGKVIRLLASVKALPEAFLYGTAYVVETSQMRSAFLNGDYSVTGWFSFFPWAFALKSTLAVLLITTLGIVLLATRWFRTPDRLGSDLHRVAPLLVLSGIYWAFSVTSSLNIGHRHILPTYPPLFILAGAVTLWLPSRQTGILTACALALLQAWEAASISPHFLSYFNALGGGPRNGHRHLVDSSIDWGQDLPGLKRWLQSQPSNAPVYLSYFGTDEPDYYKLRVRRLPFVNGFKLLYPHSALEPGLYCIGATMLQHVYSNIRGPWTLEHERQFQQLRGIEHELLAYQNTPERQAELLQQMSAGQWAQAWEQYELLRFARLCHYLRVRTPDAAIGHSIFIFRLNADELNAAVGGGLAAWRQLLEQTASPRN